MADVLRPGGEGGVAGTLQKLARKGSWLDVLTGVRVEKRGACRFDTCETCASTLSRPALVLQIPACANNASLTRIPDTHSHSTHSHAFQAVREQGMDLTGWLEFFIGGLATQLDEVKARGEIAIRSDVVARQHRLNPRQAGALDHLLAHGKLTLGDLERSFPEINRRTLQRDLKVMLDKGLVREVGTGPTDPNRHYVLGEL